MMRASYARTLAPGRTRMGTAQRGPRARWGPSTAMPPLEQPWRGSWWRRPARRRSGSCSPG
eukprot:4644-Alexandrium_andersonii.AAC.1